MRADPLRRRFPLVAVAAALALATACGGPAADHGSATEGTQGGGAGEDKLAPDFSLEDMQGNVVQLSSSHGQVRLIDFWATWCAPCIEEIPVFQELHEQYGDKGFTLLAVSTDLEGASVVRPVLEEHNVSYQNLLGNDEVQEAYGVLGLPSAYLVDQEGRIVKQYMGVVPKKILEKQIRELLGMDPAA